MGLKPIEFSAIKGIALRLREVAMWQAVKSIQEILYIVSYLTYTPRALILVYYVYSSKADVSFLSVDTLEVG